MSRRAVLVTGCSDGGTGSALAMASHKAGLNVAATVRDPAKMMSLEKAGIETKRLAILSKSSISECVGSLANLDILVNNAGAGISSPFSDTPIARAKELFDLNVWAQIAMKQACLPLLMRSNSTTIVNHGSTAAIVSAPFRSFHNASKAVLGMISDTFTSRD